MKNLQDVAKKMAINKYKKRRKAKDYMESVITYFD